ncbi:UNKNOWN [Stylonychia lemnae]|uniref:Uncharacterized protein n=1 Tax=Stylonychia lemnae TaxID=5949 RepID=A0A078B1A3_STYLE|nr:UNKNOWN [Stylonychia lemnae]|eukprot:CDW86923.1 UNKNOWN [Stylonychia lemnae]
MESQNSALGLVIISKLYQENKINDEEREKLKDMVFNDDATLMSIFDVVDEESELKEAVLKYVQLGAVDDFKEQNEPTQADIDFLNQASSPTDSALDMKKRKRLNQMAAQEEKAKKQKESGKGGEVLGINDCDVGASPQMNRSSLLGNRQKGYMSPLQGVSARQLQQNNQ